VADGEACFRLDWRPGAAPRERSATADAGEKADRADGESAAALDDATTTEAAAALEAAALDLQEIWDRAVAEIGSTVSPAQLRALLIIAGSSTVSVNALAMRLRASTSATSRLCDRLQQAGLITRATAPGDRRGVMLSLSGVGARLVNWTRERHREDLGHVVRAMTPAGRAALLKGLAELRTMVTRPG
jgi:DNA-binding MarR family transcriptional regulator